LPQTVSLYSLKLFRGVNHLVAGIGGVVPAPYLNALAFKVFVDREEVGNLFEHVRVDVGKVPHIVETRIILADSQHFLVQHALIEHLKQADGAHLLHAARKTGTRHQHQHVQRVAVIAQRGRNKAIVARVVHRRMQVAVQLEDVQLLVVFVFLGPILGDLDDRAKNLRRAIADGQFKIIHHFFWPLFRGRGRRGGNNQGKLPVPSIRRNYYNP